MRSTFFPLLVFFALVTTNIRPAAAQLISPEPLCLTIKNATTDEVLGHIETTEFYSEDGKLNWHKSNFRLNAGAEQQACSTGPFFKDYKLRVVVKTLMPLYSCLTEMNRVITISRRKNDIGINELVMDCPSERK